MSKLSLQDVARRMRDIDICMLTTRSPAGGLESRPMSNNKNVDWEGDNWFFADGSSSAAQDIASNPQVNVAFSKEPALLQKPVFFSVMGEAELITDRSEMERHWDKDIEIWFKDGLDTPGLVLIHVRATSVKYWDGHDEGELRVPALAAA